MPVVVDDDVNAAADVIRPMLALYVGGMGAKGANFHYEVLARLGYADECARIQELYLGGDRPAAIAAVPLQMVEDVALVGPVAKIVEELPRWRETVITTMLLSGPPPLLELMARLVG